MVRPLAVFILLGLVYAVSSQQCPTEEELKILGKSIDGNLVLPGDKSYWKDGEMKNTIYNSDFNFILYAKSLDDVKKYIKFVRRFGMRPSIRSSGHDYIGRSSGNNTCNLSFETFKERIVNLNDGESSTRASLKASSGNSWLDIYKEADKHNKIVLGGSAHTVALGGYYQGGGHSPLSPKLGLGVDQIISFTMVTVDGDVMEVKPRAYVFENGSQVYDSEVFRAVMGGGGGTFGIVVYFTIKMHEPPRDGFVGLTCNFALKTPSRNLSEIVVPKYSEMFRSMGENWGGFFLVRPETLDPDLYTGTLTLVLLHWGGYSQAKPIIDSIKSFRTDLNPIISVTNYSTFYDYAKDVEDPTGFRIIIANRFLRNSDFRANTAANRRFQRLVGGTQDYGIEIGCTGVLMGHTAGRNNPATSVSPQFRYGRMSLTCGAGWGFEEDDSFYEERFQQFINQHMYGVGEGTYYNEPDRNLPNWKRAYWGSMGNYDRLLRVKRKLDPENVLWCHNCVGSDETIFETPCPSGISGASAIRHLGALAIICTVFVIKLF